MFKIAIIDDEKNVRIVIKKLLNILYSNCEIVAEAASIKEALTVIPEAKPDIVLLDIELEDGNGFSLLNQLPNLDFKLIFITAFNQYAIKAFKFNALDYVLKPIEPTELQNAVDKAQKSVYTENELKQLINNAENNKTTKIVINTTEKSHFIPITDIIYCKAEGSYSTVFTKGKSILASKNLKHFEELLEDQGFIRTHQSYLVNKSKIESLKNNTLILKDSTEIPISVRRKSEINVQLNS
ncbi:LytR/AlgR family response regulator transcription factor [Olleya sp. R77988]|uniref:LytR/AlgR family response regulator transcription factor n=1 Tax=Olleya sp. R77988 TaxID=3093875 RepID=UPI0037C86646